jgi:hypothetical protein
MMRDVATLFQCECKKHIIILDGDLQGTDLEKEDVLCPVCGNEMVSEMSRNITLGSVRDDKTVWEKVQSIKDRLNNGTTKSIDDYNEDVRFLLSLLDE